jgi:hypothetical protein
MFQKINAIADKIERLVNRANYVFAVVNWSIETFRIIAGQLRAFPVSKHEEKNDTISQSDPERTAGREEQQSGKPGDNIERLEGEDKPLDPSKV